MIFTVILHIHNISVMQTNSGHYFVQKLMNVLASPVKTVVPVTTELASTPAPVLSSTLENIVNHVSIIYFQLAI